MFKFVVVLFLIFIFTTFKTKETSIVSNTTYDKTYVVSDLKQIKIELQKLVHYDKGYLSIKFSDEDYESFLNLEDFNTIYESTFLQKLSEHSGTVTFNVTLPSTLLQNKKTFVIVSDNHSHDELQNILSQSPDANISTTNTSFDEHNKILNSITNKFSNKSKHTTWSILSSHNDDDYYSIIKSLKSNHLQSFIFNDDVYGDLVNIIDNNQSENLHIKN